nr:NADH dehydrogenase subunit 3 [Potamalpheops sp. purple zebra]
MLSLSLFILTIFIIASALMMISSILSKKTINDREKNSPFECGFDPKGSARMPFSLRFFLIAVIFLIFDVEITLLLPLVPIICMSNIKTWILTSMIFILILILGLHQGWSEETLDWDE